MSTPVRKTMCSTCPFLPGVSMKYAALAPAIAESAMTAARICHQTGSDNAFHKRTGKPEHVCRGARELQLTAMCMFGVLDEPTDAAWNRERERIGMQPQAVCDP